MLSYGGGVNYRAGALPSFVNSRHLLFMVSMAIGCANPSSDAPSPGPGTSTTTATADIVSVAVSGGTGAYSFAVGIRSPDTGCQQYADWWEVVTGDGQLAHRRILAHSHVDEQPFTRSGGPVEIAADTPVFVRAHMNPGGFGGEAREGTAGGGFAVKALAADFAADLASSPPLPSGCAF